MRLDYLIDHILESLAQERALLRRLARYMLPLLLLPIGFGLAQMAHGWLGLATGGIGAGVLLAQIELFLRPILSRARVIRHDLRFYFGPEAAGEPPELGPALALLAPSVVALVVSMALFLPPILASAPTWQRLLALALGAGVLWSIWQRLSQIVVLLGRLESHLSVVRSQLSVAERKERPMTHEVPDKETRRQGDKETSNLPFSRSPYLPVSSAVGGRWSVVGGRSEAGLLDPAISHVVAGLPLPALPLSPAARALLRVEAYLL